MEKPPHPSTHELPLSTSSLPLLLSAALPDKQNQFSVYRNENETICHENGKIKVTRWFHAKNERTQTNLEHGHRRQTISFLLVLLFFPLFHPIKTHINIYGGKCCLAILICFSFVLFQLLLLLLLLMLLFVSLNVFACFHHHYQTKTNPHIYI